MAPLHSSRWMSLFFVVALLFGLLLPGCLPAKQDDLPSVTVGVRGSAAGQEPSQDQAPAAVQQQQAPIPPPAVPLPAEQPAVQPEPAPLPSQQQQVAEPTSSSGSTSLGNPAKGIYPISPSDPYSFLGIGGLTVKRTSRDKGELKEMQLIVRNIGTYGFIPIVYMTFENGVTGGSVQPRILEQKFELPYLEPGMKMEEWYPVSMYFHEIDKEKTIQLRIQEKYISPPYDFEHFVLTFIPRDKFKTDEIKWT